MIISANSEPNRSEFNLLLNSTISQLNIHASNSTKRIETLLVSRNILAKIETRINTVLQIQLQKQGQIYKLIQIRFR